MNVSILWDYILIALVFWSGYFVITQLGLSNV